MILSPIKNNLNAADALDAVVIARPVKLSEFDAWYKRSQVGDTLVYAKGGHVLPANCRTAQYVRELLETKYITAWQKRQDDQTFHWHVKRVKQPAAPCKRLGVRTGDEDLVYQLLHRTARSGDKMPDIRTISAQARVRRHEVLGLLAALEDAGEVTFETYHGPLSQSWRVATIVDDGLQTKRPPNGWGKR